MRQRRNELGKSVKEIAKDVGLSSPQFVYACEKGSHRPPLSKLPVWASAYEIEEDKIKHFVFNEKLTQLKKKIW